MVPLMKRAAALTAVLSIAASVSIAVGVAPAVAGGSTEVGSAAGASQRVTLLTGDVVEVIEAGAGKKAATVQPGVGREHVSFHTVELDGGLRVLPSDAVPFISAGVLDVDLFDVEELIADGYGDRATESLPLLVSSTSDAQLETVLHGTSMTRPLHSIDASAVLAAKAELATLWESVKPGRATAGVLDHGITKIWLDGKVRATLDRSVPRIGTPTAWEAGYEGDGVAVGVLDTGVDADHPDLVGRVARAVDFSGSPSGAADTRGHGTHVAATIAGTGAATDGTRRGVAPGAGLLVGKVLGDDGFGYESWVIAGMEWAAAEGARVVNMSLGAGPTDGTDPVSQAVNTLTEQTGTLFVVAAGNEGRDQSIGSPGAAAAALTVGAVDLDDELADFSSRGPRVGDDALKPEITAPGVGIIAARAAGTMMGEPIDELHTAASGTSMAAPHVAGAAALLAQVHPDWTAGQLKDALVSTAKSTPAVSVYAQGAGRVDLARAVRQGVYATGVVDFGLAAEPTTRTVTYRNDTDTPKTLTLSVDVDNLDIPQAPTPAFGLPPTVTVPAGGTADVELSLDPAKLDRGLHSGWIVADDGDGTRAVTAIGALRAAPKHKVTIRAVGRDGEPTSVPVWSLYGDTARADLAGWLFHGEAYTGEISEGTFLLHALIEEGDAQRDMVSLVTDPNITITGDTEILIDARKAVPITIETPKPAEQQAVLSHYVHREYGNGRKVSHGVMHFSNVQEVAVTETEPVADGAFEFSSRWQLVAPMVQASVPGVDGPLDINLLHRSPSFEGKRRFDLVAPGPRLEGVAGAVAVLEVGEQDDEEELIDAAAGAGAAAVILVRPAVYSAWTVWQPVGDREAIPALATTARDGAKLIAAAHAGGARITLRLTTSSPYLFDVLQVSKDAIPDKIVHRVTTRNSTRISTTYQDNGGFAWAKEQRFGWRPWQEYAWNDTQRFVETPNVREEWVSAGDSIWQHRVSHAYTWDDMNPLASGMTELPTSYTAGSSSEDWITPVVRPASPRGVVSTRTGDRLSLRIPAFVDAAGHYALDEATHTSAVLRKDGAVIAELANAWQDVLTSVGDGTYQLDVSTARIDPDGEWNWATLTDTSWEFRSATAPTTEAVPLPLLQVDYDVPADLNGRVNGKLPHPIRIDVHQQAGAPAPKSTTLQTEVSFDEGATWRKVATLGAKGKYVVIVPPGNGSVSLRIIAGDDTGNTVTQTVIRAYGLK